MKRMSVRRLVLAAVLFVAWLGWLAYLVITTSSLDNTAGGMGVTPTASGPIKWSRWVLSRPQFLAADLDVIANLQEVDGKPDPHVKNPEVFWARDPQQKPAGPEVLVKNLPECTSWVGPGRYILPLVRDGDGYRVPAVPRSPGFDPLTQPDPPRIYLRTEAAFRQLQEIRPHVVQ